MLWLSTSTSVVINTLVPPHHALSGKHALMNTFMFNFNIAEPIN